MASGFRRPGTVQTTQLGFDFNVEKEADDPTSVDPRLTAASRTEAQHFAQKRDELLGLVRHPSTGMSALVLSTPAKELQGTINGSAAPLHSSKYPTAVAR